MSSPETITHPPNQLYRGVTLPVTALHDGFLSQPLQVGYEAKTDAEGRKTAFDGNEFGIYMSDNRHMVEQAYANPRNGIAVPELPHVTVPKVGVLYEINPAGLDVRKPWITSYLQGVYNNGFVGDEWITDHVPAENYQIKNFKLGRDLLHREKDYPVTESAQETLTALREDFARRVGDLALLGAELTKLPEHKRRQLTPYSREITQFKRKQQT